MSIEMSVERVVFSFSLYGANPKYTWGALANARIIAKRFPQASMFVYTADSVPADITEQLKAMAHVRVIPVPTRAGSAGMFDRYLAIDSSDCDVMFVRDADSRIHERDAACIEDFLSDTEKLIQIVRDHYYHKSSRICGGIFALRKAAMIDPMSQLLDYSNLVTRYMADQHFLERTFYKRLLPHAQIYDRYGYFEPAHMLTPFRVPITDNLFIGQVHLFRPDGSEYTEFAA
jgi:hypothetical protein